MPIYKDNANNRRLKRVGMGYGKECSPCKPKSKSASKPAPAPKPVKKASPPKPVKKPKKAFKTPKKGEIFSDNIKTPVKKAPATKSANKSIEDYTDEELRKGAKNWAKVQGFKIKGIQNLSRKGLLTLFQKEKVSMDFLKFKIQKRIQYTSGMGSGGQKIVQAPGNEGGWYLSKDIL
tara:strand:+ start:112 stop:642 length:531 start_codon:yes stop_codon:yes gene_type:complete